MTLAAILSGQGEKSTVSGGGCNTRDMLAKGLNWLGLGFIVKRLVRVLGAEIERAWHDYFG